MKRFVRSILLASTVLAVAALTQGCVSHVKATTSQNPPPAEAFKAFGRIEVKQAVFKSGVTGNASALAKINQNIQLQIAASLADWNKGPGNGRTLIVEPVIEQMDFKNGAQRVMFGAMAGGSGVLMRLNIHDANGRVIASPEFYQRVGAMHGAHTFGVQDNLMLTRVAQMSATYLKLNYASAVGGMTGGSDPDTRR